MPGEKRFRVLVVDDEEDLRELIMKVLESKGLEVYGASQGEEALEKVRAIKPHLVLLDVMMPDIDGWEVCRRIKNDPGTKDVVVSMLTVRGRDPDKVKSFDYAIADWHISKPVDIEDLSKTVLWLLQRPIKREIEGVREGRWDSR